MIKITSFFFFFFKEDKIAINEKNYIGYLEIFIHHYKNIIYSTLLATDQFVRGKSAVQVSAVETRRTCHPGLRKYRATSQQEVNAVDRGDCARDRGGKFARMTVNFYT